MKLNIERLHSKEDYVNLMFTILEPLKEHYSEGKARLHLGETMAHYDKDATWMEAFSRPLWALVPFFAGGGRSEEFEEICRQGFIHGTDEENDEYWGECSPFNQRFVEMAAMAYGILFAQDVIWDPLSDTEKDNFVKYINKINEHELPVCNWILFAVLVNIALKKIGRPYSKEKLEIYMEGLETFYLGNGWYQDGDSNQKDYYVSFAIHFYSLIYSMVMEDSDPDRCRRFKERAEIFGKDFIYWFDKDGDAIPYGRSLTYRFSQVSFFSACLIADVKPFSVGVMKGLIGRHLRSWVNKPIFHSDGVLSIGYGYPNLSMGERYNAPGSPYWAMKTFAVLMLEDSHEFWSVEEEEYPELEEHRPMPEADMYIKQYGNHSTAFVPGVYSSFGHGQIVAKYGKFAYDTKFSISIAKSSYELHENAADNMLAFVINGYVYVRRICIESKILKDGVYSKWSPYEGIVVETFIKVTDEGHIRYHKIHSNVECMAYDCGFSINRGAYEEVNHYMEQKSNYAMTGNDYSSCRVESIGNNNVDEIDVLQGEGYIMIPDPNTNIMYQKTSIPCVRYKIVEGTQRIITQVNATWNKYKNIRI